MTADTGLKERAAAACPFSNGPPKPAAAQDGILGPLPGFGHFLGVPGAAERFQVDGADPRQSAGAMVTLRRRLRGLALLMGNRPAHAADNPQIPAGYTYLLQLTAHDLVSTTTGFWSAGGPRPGVANGAGAPLRLRTLYGDGPGACPFAFAPDGARDLTRSRFRLSAIGDAPAPAADAQAFRDIGRAATPGTLGTRRGSGEALLADPRNDQSALLSQVTGLFEMLHNAILDMIPSVGTLPAKAMREAAAARFAVAREATALIFRAVLRADVLPRVLDPRVQAFYGTAAPDLLDRPADGAIPLEFSHGAFRFGHAMARDTYRIGSFASASLAELLRLNSSRSPNAMPLKRQWILRWSQFFHLPGLPAPNASMKLGPQHSPMLIADGLSDPIAEGDPVGIAFRDLMSAGLAGLRSVNDLATQLLRLRPKLAAFSPMLVDPETRRSALAAWLRRDPALSLLTDADVEALAAEPPLPFYVLFEAEREAAGERLGILGSVLVAETIYGAMLREPLPAEIGDGGLTAALDRLCATWLGDWRFPDKPAVQDMPGLIAFVARRLDLTAADPAFL